MHNLVDHVDHRQPSVNAARSRERAAQLYVLQVKALVASNFDLKVLWYELSFGYLFTMEGHHLQQ